MSVPEDIGCKNSECIRALECRRTLIYVNKTAREIKSFGGTPEKGCGKFIPLKNGEEIESSTST